MNKDVRLHILFSFQRNEKVYNTFKELMTMKNFVFISPHFPNTYYRFCQALKKNGFRVLGIGDSPYHELSQELKDTLTEYYLCSDMDNFSNEVRAVQYFQDKYGHIDYLESNNEYWLEKDAQLREMFGITTGIQGRDIDVYQHKSMMKERYKQAGCPCSKFILVEDFEQVKKFAEEVGYPVFIKPDVGVGAAGDFKIKSEADLVRFFDEKYPNVTYICEQFITGNIVSFDGVANSKSEVIFATSNFFPPSIADVVQEHRDVFYYTLPKVPDDLLEIGKKVIKAFKVQNRFFHLEFFRLTEDIPGVGKKGEIAALETNMRPAGGYTPDLINFANSVDCYQIWADCMAYDENRQFMGFEKYYAGCASRRDCYEYFHSDEEVISTYKNCLCAHGRYPLVFSGAMGNRYFMAKFKTIEEMEEFEKYVELRK